MTPESLVIDRKFRGVGRIKKATGTTNPAVRRKFNRMLTALSDEGRLDILRAIRDGHVTLMQVHDAYQAKTLEKLPIGNTVGNLADRMELWRGNLREGTDASKHHIASLKSSIGYFRDAAPNATVADIASVLEGLRESLGRKYPRSYNVARSCALAFVRSTLKRSSPLWLACASVEPRKVPKTTKRRPFSVEEMNEAFPDREKQDDAIAWAMVTTGMGPKEYFSGNWETRRDRVHIDGTKRGGRKRDVPLVLVPFVSTIHRRTWEDHFRKRCPNHVAYDLRRTYANWMEDAGIPRTRRKLYMGHGATDVTDLYEKRQVEEFLAVDAGKLRRYVGLPIVAKRRLQRVK